MKTKVMGILIFLFFILTPFMLEGGNVLKFFTASPIMIVFGTSTGLTIASYRKGMDKQLILKKAKKYLVFSGYFGALCGVIGVFGTLSHDLLVQTPERLLAKLSMVLVPLFWAYIGAYIIDTFINE